MATTTASSSSATAIEVSSSHVPMVSQPEAVTELIEAAAKGAVDRPAGSPA